MKTTFMRALTAILALLMLASTAFLVACSGGNNDSTATTAPDAATTVSAEADNEPVKTSVLDGVKFDGVSLGVYCWSDTNVPEYVDPDKVSTSVEQSIGNRMIRVEEQLGITTDWKLEPGNSSNKSFIENVSVANQSGADFDVVCCYSEWASTFTMRGIFRNFRDYGTYMNFEHPCYPQKMINDCTIDSKLFFLTGDISNNLIYMSSLVYFNKDILENYRIDAQIEEKYSEDNIYRLVEHGKWTNEALFTLSSGIYEDLDKDGQMSANDLYGFGSYETLIDNFYYGAGLKTIVATDEGLAIAEDLDNGDMVTAILTDVNNFMHTSGYARLFKNYAETKSSFANQRTLFNLAPASHAYLTHSKAEGLVYGVLPVPKYTAEQDAYYSVHSIPYSMYGITSGSDTPEAAAAFIEAMGEAAYELTRPVFFEETMKARYSESYDDSLMWDMIIDSQAFDLGRIFADAFSQSTIKLFRSQVTNNTAAWSVMKGQLKTIQKYADTINTEFGNLK